MRSVPPSKLLTGPPLGLASGNTLWLDDNAAGWGWFVDTTPWDDSEFTTPGNPLTLPSPLGGEGNGERGRMDLLTVVMHELGHLLGFEHSEPGASATGDVMLETLAAGARHTDLEHEHVLSVDQLFGQSSDHRADAWLGAWLNEQFESTHLRAKRRR